MLDRSRSAEAFARAKMVIPGGVNSPVRSFKGVGGEPVFIASGFGAWLTDVDGNRYRDFVGSWGPLVLGHAHPAVVRAIASAAGDGTSFGAPTERETSLAALISSMMPRLEMVRFVNSGTEATMSAVRLARGITGRDAIVKFEGCYHGHGDAFLIAAGSGATTLGVPDSPGVTRGVAQDTLPARYNDLAAVDELFRRHGPRIAAVIVEPVAGNMGVVPPRRGFLQGLRDLTKANGTLLIFDEVMTGFRVAPGGAQELFGVMPDITALGKIIGGGLPVGAYGGPRDVMSHVSPSGPVYQAGTLSGNPIAMAAGLATLQAVREDPGFYARLERNSALLARGMEDACRSAGIPAVVNRVGSMMTLFFTGLGKVADYGDARTCDGGLYARYFHAMLESGIYLPPSQFEALFVSAAHTEDDVVSVVGAMRKELPKIKGKT
jgi:glutamate-1-semialdehyde 2,1-aminomutase